MDRIEKLHDEMMANQIVAKAPETPATPTTPSPDDDFEIDGKKVTMPEGITSEKTKSDWRTWKGMAKTKITALEKQVGEVTKRLEEMPKLETKKWEDQLSALAKEKAELEEQLGQVSLERTPEFQRHYTNKLEASFKEAREIVGEAHAEKIDGILRLPEGKHKRELLNQLFAELDESQKAELGGVRSKIRDTLSERTDAITNWKSQMEAKGKRDTVLAAEARGKLDATFLSAALEARKDPDLIAFQTREGDEAWNKAIETTIADAKNLFASDDPAMRAKAALAAASHKAAVDRFRAVQAENEQLKQHIASLKAVKPEIRGGESIATAPTVRADGKAESLSERISRLGAEQGFVK